MNLANVTFLLEYIEFGKIQKDFDTTDFCILAYSSDETRINAGSLCFAFRKLLELPNYADTSFFSQTGNLTVALVKTGSGNSEPRYLFCQIQSRDEGERARSLGNLPRVSRPYEQIRFTYFTEADVRNFIIPCLQENKAIYADFLYREGNQFFLRNFLSEAGKESQFKTMCQTSNQLSAELLIKAQRLVEFVLSQKEHISWRVRVHDIHLNWQDKLKIIIYVQANLFQFHGIFSFALDYVSRASNLNVFFYPQEKSEPDKNKNIPEVDLNYGNDGELRLFQLLQSYLKESNAEAHKLIRSLWETLNGLEFDKFLIIARDFASRIEKTKPAASELLSDLLNDPESKWDKTFFDIWNMEVNGIREGEIYLLSRVNQSNLPLLFQKLISVYNKKIEYQRDLIIRFAPLVSLDEIPRLVSFLDNLWNIFEEITNLADVKKKQQLAPFYSSLFAEVIKTIDEEKKKKVLEEFLEKIISYAVFFSDIYVQLFDFAVRHQNAQQIADTYALILKSIHIQTPENIEVKISGSLLDLVYDNNNLNNFYQFYENLERQDKFDVFVRIIDKVDSRLSWLEYVVNKADSISKDERDSFTQYALQDFNIGYIDTLITQNKKLNHETLVKLLREILNQESTGKFRERIIWAGLVEKYIEILPEQNEDNFVTKFQEYKKNYMELVEPGQIKSFLDLRNSITKKDKKSNRYLANLRKIKTSSKKWYVFGEEHLKFSRTDFKNICLLCAISAETSLLMQQKPLDKEQLDYVQKRTEEANNLDFTEHGKIAAIQVLNSIDRVKKRFQDINAPRSSSSEVNTTAKQKESDKENGKKNRLSKLLSIRTIFIFSFILDVVFSLLFLSSLNLTYGYLLITSLVLTILSLLSPTIKMILGKK